MPGAVGGEEEHHVGDVVGRGDLAERDAELELLGTGLDLLDWPRERAVTAADLPPPLDKPRSRTHADLLRRVIERETPTVEQLLWRPEVIGSAHWQVIGTVDDAIEAIRDWTEAGAIDGFIAVPGGSVSSLHLVFDELVPRLVEAGLFRESYSGTTFADHLRE